MALLCAATWNVEAFAVPSQVATPSMKVAITSPPTKLFMIEGSPLTLAVDTVDPTNFLQDVFGSILGTPIILAVPIVAALGVASLVVFAIVAYANPAEPDD